jgi:hypothetical protein
MASGNLVEARGASAREQEMRARGASARERKMLAGGASARERRIDVEKPRLTVKEPHANRRAGT